MLDHMRARIRKHMEKFSPPVGLRRNPRGCATRADHPAGAGSVHLDPGKPSAVLAFHFYRMRDAASPTAYGRQHALDTVMYRSKLCASNPHIDSNDMNAVAQCATRVFSRVEETPWAAFLIISPALASTFAASAISENLALIMMKSKLVAEAPEFTTFYVLAK